MRFSILLGLLTVIPLQTGCFFLQDDGDDRQREAGFFDPPPSLVLESLALADTPPQAPGDLIAVELLASEVVGLPEVHFQIIARHSSGTIETLEGANAEVPLDGVLAFERDLVFRDAEVGSYEVSVQASFEDQVVETQAFSVVWAPVVESVDLVEIDDGDVLEGGEVVEFLVQGSGLRKQRLVSQVLAHSLKLDTTTVVGRVTVHFDDGSEVQQGRGIWSVRGDFLDRVDTHEIVFSLPIVDQASESFLVDVPFILSAIEYRAINGETEVEAPPTQRLDLRSAPTLAVVLHGEGLLGRTISFQAAPEGGTPQTAELVAQEDDSVRWEYAPDRAFAEKPVFNTDHLIEVEGKSLTGVLTMVRWGFLRCAFLYQSGAQIAAGEAFRSPVNLLLRVETWGVPDRDIELIVDEQDRVSDDTVHRLRVPLTENVAETPLSLSYVNDGFGDRSEFRFSVRIGEAGCQSPVVEVVR
jgi:hypothetical protein